ncbi:hypothetical protein PPERSA_08881 [Pseudocohnilembus persalinus]|uniref:Rhomboid-like protease n=1 Tax=Pseudocohnilembus persalinus TaxID=266149 RepID=A0A0V0QDT7_PSEPJ|nr:hypothetical protein PPERSA_08881 [Pseudocohnilembus persalinus]|eukprot:KRX00375.1 hypothetical protein PPERSA_08881 [Pseudocohnilembus persalinus]
MNTNKRLPPLNNQRKGRRSQKKNFELETPTKQTMANNDLSFQNQTSEQFLTRENENINLRQRDLFDLEITKIHRKNSIHEISIDNNKELDFSLVDKDYDDGSNKNQKAKQQFQQQNKIKSVLGNQDQGRDDKQKQLYEEKRKQQEAMKLQVPILDKNVKSNNSGIRKNRQQVKEKQMGILIGQSDNKMQNPMNVLNEQDNFNNKKPKQQNQQQQKQQKQQQQQQEQKQNIKNPLKIQTGQELQSDAQAQAKKDEFAQKKKKWMRQNVQMIRNAKIQEMGQKLKNNNNKKKMSLMQVVCPKIQLKSFINVFAGLFVLCLLLQYIMKWGSEEYMACVLYDLQVYFQPDISNGVKIYKYFTTAFLHGGVINFVFSFFSLLFFGYKLEYCYGKLKVILVFFYCCVIGCTFGGLQNKYLIQAGGSYSTMGLLGLQLSIFYTEYKITQKHKNMIMNYIIYLIFGLCNLIVGKLEGKFVNLLGSFMSYIFGIFFGLIFINVKQLAQQIYRYRRKQQQAEIQRPRYNQIQIDNAIQADQYKINTEQLEKIESIQKFFFGIMFMLGVVFIILSCFISTDKFQFTDERCNTKND